MDCLNTTPTEIFVNICQFLPLSTKMRLVNVLNHSIHRRMSRLSPFYNDMLVVTNDLFLSRLVAFKWSDVRSLLYSSLLSMDKETPVVSVEDSIMTLLRPFWLLPQQNQLTRLILHLSADSICEFLIIITLSPIIFLPAYHYRCSLYR